MSSLRSRLKASLTASLIALSTCLAAVASAADVGTKAPDFELATQDGKLKLSDLRGHYVYLDFWASWCGPCKQSFPWMNGLHDKYSGKGLKVLGISVDKKIEEAKQFLKEVPAKFAVAFDDSGTTPKAYSVKGMPTSLLISPDGTVLFVHQSFKDSDKQDLETKIKNAMEKK
jgi:cytochrome c biogenesis protein CcmG, thiol:disulfide interchange protein DsbE